MRHGFVGLCQSRLAGVSLNYLDGDLDDTAKAAIRRFLGRVFNLLLHRRHILLDNDNRGKAR